MNILMRNIFSVSVGGLILCASFNVLAVGMLEFCNHNRDDPSCRGVISPTSSSGGNSMFSGLIVKAFSEMGKQQARRNQAMKEEYAILRPPHQARYSQAKTYLSGQTLIIENEQPIWFSPNGKASTRSKIGFPISQKWFVKGDQFCMGKSKRNAECMRFVFRGKNTSIKTSSGRMVNTFQLLDINLVN